MRVLPDHLHRHVAIAWTSLCLPTEVRESLRPVGAFTVAVDLRAEATFLREVYKKNPAEAQRLTLRRFELAKCTARKLMSTCTPEPPTVFDVSSVDGHHEILARLRNRCREKDFYAYVRQECSRRLGAVARAHFGSAESLRIENVQLSEIASFCLLEYALNVKVHPSCRQRLCLERLHRFSSTRTHSSECAVNLPASSSRPPRISITSRSTCEASSVQSSGLYTAIE